MHISAISLQQSPKKLQIKSQKQFGGDPEQKPARQQPSKPAATQEPCRREEEGRKEEKEEWMKKQKGRASHLTKPLKSDLGYCTLFGGGGVWGGGGGG